MKEHPAMTDHLHPDPLHLAAALDFLGDPPAPMTTLSPATAERRHYMYSRRIVVPN